MKKILLFFLVLFFSFALPVFVFARIGVGVGSGKIVVDEKLKPGGIYDLPSLPVLNTGDESSGYGVSIEYHEKQPQLAPPKEWFKFEPENFNMEPGKITDVKIVLTIPIKATPGEYFAYLEAHPSKKSEAGVTSVGIAAATKLYFTVAPANFLQGIAYKIYFFWKYNSPWTWIILAAVILVLLIIIFKKRFKFEINVSSKK